MIVLAASWLLLLASLAQGGQSTPTLAPLLCVYSLRHKVCHEYDIKKFIKNCPTSIQAACLEEIQGSYKDI